MKKLVVLGLSILAISITGCSSAPESNSGQAAVIEVGNVDYNSLYHFGYDSGCSSALAQKTSNESLESMKDKSLGGLDAFEDGWRSGIENCNNGVFNSMYTVGIEK